MGDSIPFKTAASFAQTVALFHPGGRMCAFQRRRAEAATSKTHHSLVDWFASLANATTGATRNDGRAVVGDSALAEDDYSAAASAVASVRLRWNWV
jgi:hypothetical protein